MNHKQARDYIIAKYGNGSFELASFMDHGRILDGLYKHWCPDWDYLTIDETCHEWPCVCSNDLLTQAGDENRG